ncbi:hypothetical protein [Noviherbaspirillum pedocola]|jgi:hypothetical protein|uniref:Uncharacterized protein n=1 Tax=Noviherbaspirillum pedocola TaxID=2801341 RepID=A0A934SZL7_9BURK|nr:hypothetical protein [Noviherbaspirillum pedocola]MBK4737931.1 hypothetical protein [Noviherbaspirillum pedocola]
MKQRTTHSREADNPAPIKAIMTAPPMTQQQFDHIKKQRSDVRRRIEEAHDARTLRQSTSSFDA